ncbi:MAG: hypothetical protein HOY79_19660, partial [Streptomyces sp.]|nr:hypothetical protein [Streptomyces sp.]
MDAVAAAIGATAAERGERIRNLGLLKLCRQVLDGRAPGELRVTLEIILRLSRRPVLVAEVLDRAGFGPRVGRAEVMRALRSAALQPSSCAHCDAWKADGTYLCRPCRSFRAGHSQLGACARCGRERPLKQGWCRMCLYVLAHFGERAFSTGIQLSLAGITPLPQNWRGFRLVTGTDGVRRPTAVIDVPTVLGPGHCLSPALTAPGQLALFPCPPRRWEVLDQRELPALGAEGQALRRELAMHAERHGWETRAFHAHQRTLTLITAWLGLDAPIEEADLWAMSRLSTSYNARRLVPFLSERGLLVPDHVRHADPDRAGVARLRQRVP